MAKNFTPTISNPLGTVRCSYQRGKFGGKDQCGRISVENQIYCEHHLYSSIRNTEKEIKRMEDYAEKAREKILKASVRAVEITEEIMEYDEKSEVRLKAADNLIKYSGIAAAQKVEVDMNYGESAADIVAKRMMEIRERNSQVYEIEAVVVEEEEKNEENSNS